MKYFIERYNLKHIRVKNELLSEISLRNLKDNFYYSNLRYFNNINVLWTKIQKNSSSTIFLSLSIENDDNKRELLNIIDPEVIQRLNSENNRLYQKLKKDFLNIICFRHPKKRVISLFLDKLVNNCYIDENSIRLLNKINKDYNKIKFKDFLNFILGNEKLNKLWKSQTTYILFNHYDYIFETDTIDSNWLYNDIYKFCFHATSIKPKISIDNINDLSILEIKEILKTNSISWDVFFNREIEELFNFIYKDDILLYETMFNKKIH